MPRLRRVSGTPTPLDLDAVSEPYAAAFAQPPYCETQEQVAELRDRLLRYSERDGYRLTLATVDGLNVGMAMSVHAREGDWWREHAVAALSHNAAATWFGGVVREVVHVAVTPAQQRRGVGRALVEDALDDDAVTAVVLSCRPDVPAAQQLYLTAGFEILTTDFTTARGQLPYWLMARRPRS